MGYELIAWLGWVYPLWLGRWAAFMVLAKLADDGTPKAASWLANSSSNFQYLLAALPFSLN